MRLRPSTFILAILSLTTFSATLPPTGAQIHSLLFDRRDQGGNSFPFMVDPPLWTGTHYLLEGDSHSRMLSLLDDLLSQNVEQTIPDTRQRALLQHELWQVFDWTTKNDRDDQSARVALRKKLAVAI